MELNLSLPTFLALAAAILVSAVLCITRRNTITAALFLALSLISVAALYVTQGAEFLFAVQVLVYTGGVMVLFLFVIMLVNIEELALIRGLVRRWAIPAVLVAVSFAALAWATWPGHIGQALDARTGAIEATLGSNTRAIALLLFTDYLLLFEIVSVLLLVAMIGAILLARKES